MCYTQHSTASRSVSGDNKNVLHTALHSESLRLWGQQECVTHSTPQRVVPSLGTTRMCYTQHSTAKIYTVIKMCIYDVVMKLRSGEYFNVDPLSIREFGPLSNWDIKEPLKAKIYATHVGSTFM